MFCKFFLEFFCEDNTIRRIVANKTSYFFWTFFLQSSQELFSRRTPLPAEAHESCRLHPVHESWHEPPGRRSALTNSTTASITTITVTRSWPVSSIVNTIITVEQNHTCYCLPAPRLRGFFIFFATCAGVASAAHSSNGSRYAHPEA